VTDYKLRTDGPMTRPDLPDAHAEAHALLAGSRSGGLLDVLGEVLAQDGADHRPAALYAACELLVRVHANGGGCDMLRRVVGDRLGPMYPTGAEAGAGVEMIRAALGMGPTAAIDAGDACGRK
jgi:hypothetical protein